MARGDLAGAATIRLQTCLAVTRSRLDPRVFAESLRRRFGALGPEHRAIAAGLGWSFFFLLVARLFGAAKEIAIAFRFGVGATVDAYVYLTTLIGWPVGVWFSVLIAVFVPLSRRLATDGNAAYLEFRRELFGLTLAVSAAVFVIGLVAFPALISSPSVGLAGNSLQTADELFVLLLISAPLGITAGFLAALMISQSTHSVSLIEGVPAAVLLVVLLAFPLAGAMSLGWGTAIGASLHVCVLITVLHRMGVIGSPRLSLRSPAWKGFSTAFTVVLTSQLLLGMTVVIDQFFLSQLPEGSISTVGYANRLLALFLTLGATAVSRATLPVFSEINALDGQGRVASVALRWAVALLLAGLVFVVIVWFVARMGVQLFFERGTFSSEDTAAVTAVLRVGLLQIPFYLGGLVITSHLASTGHYGWLAVSGVANLVVKVIANWVLVPMYGASGVMLSTVVMYVFALIFLGILFRRFSRDNS